MCKHVVVVYTASEIQQLHKYMSKLSNKQSYYINHFPLKLFVEAKDKMDL